MAVWTVLTPQTRAATGQSLVYGLRWKVVQLDGDLSLNKSRQNGIHRLPNPVHVDAGAFFVLTEDSIEKHQRITHVLLYPPRGLPSPP